MPREIVCVKFTRAERAILEALFRRGNAESLSQVVRDAVLDMAGRTDGLRDLVERADKMHSSERPRRSRALAKLIGRRRRPPAHVSPRS